MGSNSLDLSQVPLLVAEIEMEHISPDHYFHFLPCQQSASLRVLRGNSESSNSMVDVSCLGISKTHVCMLSRFSCIQLLATIWTVALQAPLSMGLSRKEYWSGLPCPPPRDLSGPGIEPMSLKSPALEGEFFITSTPGKPPSKAYIITEHGKKQNTHTMGTYILEICLYMECLAQTYDC